MLKRLLIIISISFFASCVPNKDLVYLQGKPVAKKDVYKLNNEPYRLQVDDVLSIDIKAKDEQSVALFKKTLTTLKVFSEYKWSRSSKGYSIDRHGNIDCLILEKLMF